LRAVGGCGAHYTQIDEQVIIILGLQARPHMPKMVKVYCRIAPERNERD
jgi:hypothetical protein